MDPTKPDSSKISDVVKLQQTLLKKWKKLAVAPKSGSKKSISFLKRTLSFSSDHAAPSPARSADVPRGFLAVCVGEEMRRFVIPTGYLRRRAFVALLREAEEEYGFQQEGVLRIPCDVSVFESLLRAAQQQKNEEEDGLCHCSAEAEFASYCGSTRNSLCR